MDESTGLLAGKTPLIELAGKTMGIVGFGRIGRRVGELARAFGMSILAYDLFPPMAPAEGPVKWCELDDLFARADVISLHCPLTPQTAGLVNRERLRLVKPSAFLINTARGALVVEADLADGSTPAGWPGPPWTWSLKNRSAPTTRFLEHGIA